jgi:hypothetical protein
MDKTTLQQPPKEAKPTARVIPFKRPLQKASGEIDPIAVGNTILERQAARRREWGKSSVEEQQRRWDALSPEDQGMARVVGTFGNLVGAALAGDEAAFRWMAKSAGWDTLESLWTTMHGRLVPSSEKSS